MSIDDEGGVLYSFKELVAELRKTLADNSVAVTATLARIEAKLDHKADKEQVDALDHRLVALELHNAKTVALPEDVKALRGDVDVLLSDKNAAASVDKSRRRQTALIVVVLTALFSGGGLLVLDLIFAHHP